MMKILYSVIPFVFGFILLYGCNDTTIHSGKTTSPVKIDGKISEWNVKDFTSVNDNQIMLGSTKDKDFVYIAGMTTNKNLIRQASLNGITLWIDPTGDKNKDLEMEIKLPQSKHIDYYKGGFFASLTKEQKMIVLHSIDSLKLGVIVNDKKTDTSINFVNDRNNKFAGKIYSSHDTLTFEVKIPLAINQIFTSYQPITNNSIFGITSPAGFAGFQNRSVPAYTPFTIMDETKKDTINRRKNETIYKPEDFEVWFKIEDNKNE